MGRRLKRNMVEALDREAMWLDCRRCGSKGGTNSQFCYSPSGRKMRVPHAERRADLRSPEGAE